MSGDFAKFILAFLGWLLLLALTMGVMSIKPKSGRVIPRFIYTAQVILLFTVAGLAFTFSVSVFFSLRAQGTLIIGAVYSFVGFVAFLGALKKSIRGENPFAKQKQQEGSSLHP